MPEELAVINYTSGTTGYSKGVMLPYRSLWSNIAYCHEMLPVKPGDPHRFDASHGTRIRHGLRFSLRIFWGTPLLLTRIAVSQNHCTIICRNQTESNCFVPLIVEKIIKKIFSQTG